jgi:hypothetical protein
MFRSLAALVALSAITNIHAQTLQPRDLDGNQATVEAYYFAPLNITWLADANIGLSETFGLERAPITDFSTTITEVGSMLRGSLGLFFTTMNQTAYLGQTAWRLPIAQSSGDPGCSVQMPAGETNLTWGTDCSGPEAGQFNQFLLNQYGTLDATPFINLDTTRRWLDSSGPSGRHYFAFGQTNSLNFCGSGRCDVGQVWPVHDGDIGTAIDCIDTDGDGWGWNGVSSCQVEIIASNCVDTAPVGDGWGWDGVSSCQLQTSGEGQCRNYGHYPWGWNDWTQTSCRLDDGPELVDNPEPVDNTEPEDNPPGECIDTTPEGDGWGWNGVTSCQLPVSGEGICRNYGHYPWGWNDWTGTSCRLDE